MRLLERTLTVVRIAARGVQADARGCERATFDLEHTAVARACVLPVSNTLGERRNGIADEAFGVCNAGARRLLFPKDTAISVGDGVLFSGEETVRWVCTRVDDWSMHREVRLERRA